MSNNQKIKNLRSAVFFIVGLILFIPLIPPIISGFFYFPYIFPKALAFQVLVEILAVLYFYLAYLSRPFRPKINLTYLLLILFVFAAFVSSAFGLNFSRSFWGTVERGEGLVFWLHLLAFFGILINTLKEKADWHLFFDFSLLSGFFICVVALGQIFGLLASPGGLRATAWFGNASVLGSYLIFLIALAAYQFSRKPDLWQKLYYGGLLLLFVFVIFNTFTRGAILGLACGLLVCGLLALVNKSVGAKIKLLFGAVIALIIISGIFIYLNRQSDWLKGNEMLNRLAGISLTDTSAVNRLATWESSLEGWQDRIWLGYGVENFNVVFNRHFPAVIFNDINSQIWFDRAHNLIFDRGLTTGLIGLWLYLAFVFVPLYCLYKSDADFYHKLPLVGLVVAFFVQDLFVFETVTTYIILIFCWAFISSESRAWPADDKRISNKFSWPLYLSLILFLPIMFFANLRPALANLDFLKALHMPADQYSLQEVAGQFQKTLAVQTPGLYEYRFRYLQFMDEVFAIYQGNAAEIKPYLELADNNAREMVVSQPENAAGYLLAMRHFNVTNHLIAGQETGRLDEALAFMPKLRELAPNHSQVYREAAYSNLYLYRLYLAQGEKLKAEEAINNAQNLIGQAIKINPNIIEFRVDQIMVLLNKGATAEIKELLNGLEAEGINYRTAEILFRLAGLSISNKNFELAAFFSEEFLEIQPGNIEVRVNLALAYAYLGRDEKAIETANKIIEISGGQNLQASAFIEKVKSGGYR